MSTVINIHDAKTHLSKILSRVSTGEEIIIAKAGKPIARLTAFESKTAKRKPGSAKGKIIISEDFYKPLPDDILDSFK